MMDEPNEPVQCPDPRNVSSAPSSRNVELLFFAGLFVLWFALQVWILPKARVPT
jgi:hypothetical protein